MKRNLFISVSLILLLLLSVISGCTPPAEPEAPPEGVAPGTEQPEVEAPWEWPNMITIVTGGQSQMAHYVSWTSIMEADTGVKVRVATEASNYVGWPAVIASPCVVIPMISIS